ncbi:MAG: NUDIX hydrolase, partial [Halobacteriaceae archaeon]
MESSKPARWNTVDESIAYSCSGFDVINQQVELSDGTRTEFDYIDEPDAVVILPFTVDDTVVIIKEWRQAVERYNYGLPAGSIKADESLEEGAQRELQEETG